MGQQKKKRTNKRKIEKGIRKISRWPLPFEDVFKLSRLQAGGERFFDGDQVLVQLGDVEVRVQVIDGAEIIALLRHRKQVVEAMHANLAGREGRDREERGVE